MRLIDADALMEKYHKTAVWDSWVEINNAPTIEATPVVHGRWEHKPGAYFEACSQCGAWYDVMQGTNDGRMNYCPNCGAKMEEP